MCKKKLIKRIVIDFFSPLNTIRKAYLKIIQCIQR